MCGSSLDPEQKKPEAEEVAAFCGGFYKVNLPKLLNLFGKNRSAVGANPSMSFCQGPRKSQAWKLHETSKAKQLIAALNKFLQIDPQATAQLYIIERQASYAWTSLSPSANCQQQTLLALEL